MPSRRGHVDHGHLERRLRIKKSLGTREFDPIVRPIAPIPPPPPPTPPPGGGGGGNGGGEGNNNGGGDGEDGGGGGKGEGDEGDEGNGAGDGSDGEDGGGGGNGAGDERGAWGTGGDGGNSASSERGTWDNGGDGGGDAGNDNEGDNGNGGNSSHGGGHDNGSGAGASSPGDTGGRATNKPTSTSTQSPSPVGRTGTTESTNSATSALASPIEAANVGMHLTHTVSSATSSGYIAVTTDPSSSSTGFSSLSQSQSGITDKDDSGSNTVPTSLSTTALNENHGLSLVGIAGIVTILLVVGLGGLILALRRRAIIRRTARRRWFAKKGASAGLYADYDNPRNNAANQKLGSPPGGRSTRSSFATTFDHSHSLKFGFDFDTSLPAIPPMAEIRREGSLVASAASSNLASKSQRKSTGSSNSNSSDSNAYTNSIQGDDVIDAPMSVRPFSPSEWYSFPRPPPSREGISLLHKDGNSNDRGADKVWSLINASQTPLTAADPFADPVSATAMQPNFSESDLVTIQRSFVPTLSDELVVAVGDRVRIFQTFDDGWAFVQKIPRADGKKGKTRAVDEFDQGLIPIDCLRNGNQDLPAFLLQKPVSTNVEDV